MKKIYFLPLLILSLFASAQQPVEINQPYNFHKYISIGKYTTATLPAASACPRCVVFNTDSLNFAFSTGTNWLYYGNGGGGGALTVNWGQIGGGNPLAQLDLKNILNQKMNYTDTSLMLSKYMLAALGVKYADTAGMLSHYLQAALGVKYTDTGGIVAPYLKIINFTKAGIGLGHVADSIQVFNAGGMTSLQKGTFAAIPAASGGPTMYFATDTLAWYYNDGSAYHKMAGGGGGGGGGAFYDSTLMLSTFAAKNTYLRIDSFSAPGIARILGFSPYSSLNPAGYITGNQSISFAPAGGDVTGTTSGSTSLAPTLTIIANAVTYAKFQQSVGKSIVGNSQAGTANNRAIFPKFGLVWDADSVKADTSSLVSKTFLNARAYLQAETDPVAIAKTITLTGTANRGIKIAEAGQALGGNPIFTLTADTAFLATLTNLQRNYIPLVWNSNQVVTGNTNIMHVLNGSLMADLTSLRERVSVAGNNITLWDSNFSQGGSILVLPNKTGFFLQQSVATPGHGIHIVNDSVTLFDDAPSTATYFFANGNAKFQGHVTGILESTSDSSLNLITTAGVKRLLAAFTPGGGGATLTFGSGLLGGSYNGSAAVTAKVDSGLYATKSFASGLPFIPTGSMRIAPIDSLTRVANGLQFAGTTLVPQTANASNPGMETAAHWAETDSLIRRLLKSKIALGNKGAGLTTAYSSPNGDSLNFKNLGVTSDFLLTTLSDSSLQLAVNFSSGTIVGLTNTQTLTNKTLSVPKITGLSASADTTTYKAIGLDGSGNLARLSFWPGGGGGGGGSQNLSFSGSAFADTIKISGGTGITLPAATHSIAGVVTAAVQSRIDSFVVVNNSGHGHGILRAPFSKDSLIARGINIVAGTGATVTYIGNKDSLAWRIDFTGAGAGTVTSVNTSTTATASLFTATGGPISTAGTFTFGLANAGANTLWGSVAGGTPAYFTPSLTSTLFGLEGSVTTVLHGNAIGNLTFSAVNLQTDVTGLLQAAQFPALIGDVSTNSSSLTTAIGAGKVTNTMLAGSIDLATKMTGILSGAQGGTGVNNTGKTVTLGGNLTTSGAFASIFNMTAATNVTFPTSGTLLTTNGTGASLTNIPLSATGTANMVLVNGTNGTPQTGPLTFTLPQAIHAGASPTFTALTLTGLPTGAGTDNVVTIAGSVLKSTPASSILATANVASSNFTPLLQAVNNITSGQITLFSTSYYQRIGNIVHASMVVQINPQPGNGQDFSLTVSPPIAATFSNNQQLHGVVIQSGSTPGDPPGTIGGINNAGALSAIINCHVTANGGNGNALYIEYTYTL